MSVTLLVGTRKGLFQLHSDDRRSWKLEGPTLEGWDVLHAIVDRRDGVLYTAANTYPYGGTVQRSSDMGKTWERAEEIGLPEESGLKLEKTWHVRPGNEPGEVWLGAAPGALLRSTDGGATFESVASLTQHETRDRWEPGAGGMCCHSIQLDAEDPNRMYVAISAAGAFRTDDGAETWTPINKNVAADFHPEKYPEVGQCVHKLLAHPAKTERLWQQNHCGVYRSDDRGDELGAARRQRPAQRLRLPDHAPPARPRHGLGDPGGGRPQPRHGRRPARRLSHAGRRRVVGADGQRSPRPGMDRRAARGVVVRLGGPGRPLLRHAGRLGVGIAQRGRRVDRGRGQSAADPLRGGALGGVTVLLPSILAAEAGGQGRFELEADKVGDALRALPVANMLFDERGELRRLVNVYVDGVDIRGGDGVESALAGGEELRVVQAVAGGRPSRHHT